MKKILSAAAAVAMGLSLAACGGGNASADAANTYIFSSELDIKNLDSADSDDGMSFTAMHACIDGLMGVDADGATSFALAADKQVSDDGLVLTYTLKDDLTWSNGDAVTADDFVYAAYRIFENNGNYAYLYGEEGAHIVGADELMAKMEEDDFAGFTEDDLATLGVNAIDEKTVEYTLTLPVSYFDEFLAFPCFYPINEAFAEECGDLYGKAADKVLSNGAFVMKTWEVGKVATYEKNPGYWNAENVKIDNLTMNLVVSPEVAATSFDNGETDFAFINSSLVDAWKDNEAFTKTNDGYLFYISINTVNPDLANANIRRALSLAIDRADLCDNILKDGSVPAGGFVPTNLAANSEGADFRGDNGTFTAYDIEAAQAALDAGLKELGKDSITIDLLYGTDESPMDIFATYLQGAFSKLDGIELTMTATTKQDRIYNRQTNGDYDICVTRWGPDYADPTTYLNLAVTGNSNNYGKYSSAEYDKLMNSVNTGTDMVARWQDMKDAEAVLLDDMGFIPVFEKGSAALINPKAKGVVIKAVGVPYTFNYATKG